MSRRKTERLLGLVVCLLSSPRYLTAVQIRAAVPGYPESFEAFKRMFERDKEELRELGIPLETGFNSPGDDEAGYRIPRQAYVLPEIRLEPDEAAVLSLAARVWRQAELAGAAAGALLKLRAAGVDAAGGDGPARHRAAAAGRRGGLRPAVGGGAGPAAGHVRLPRGRAERTPAAPPPAVGGGEPARPLVRGRDDTDRDAARVFRLSRIEGEVRFTGPAGSVIVPEGTDVRETVREWDTQPPAQQRAAVLRVRQGAGYGIRRYATAVPDPTGCRTAGQWPGEHGRLGHDQRPVLGRRLVRRAPRVIRHGCGRARARRPPGGRHYPAEGGAGVNAAPRSSAGTSTTRLQRLLALVPYVVSRKVVGLAETAAAFGVSERELVDDLNLLWCVELRSPDPYCPIDLSYEGGEIVVSQAESMDRPLRLAVDEASALLVALRMLAEIGQVAAMPGLDGGQALNRTIAKLEAAAGEAATPSTQVAIQVDKIAQQAVLDQLRDALARRRRVHMSYYVPGRDEATERDVDPMRLLIVEGRTYLEGWCRRAEAVRLFRLDRVLALDVLEVAAEVPADAEPRGPGPGPVPAVRRGPQRRSSISPRSAGGSRSTTPATPPRNSVTGGSGSRCAPRTPAGSGGWPCGWGKTAGSWPRPTWVPGSGRMRRLRWRSILDASGATAATWPIRGPSARCECA